MQCTELYSANETTRSTQEFPSAKKWDIFQSISQLPDLNPIKHDFQLLNTNLNAEKRTNKKLKVATVKVKQSTSACPVRVGFRQLLAANVFVFDLKSTVNVYRGKTTKFHLC